MKNFDQYIKNKAEEEQIEIPDSVKAHIEQTLADLPEKKPVIKQIRILPRIVAAAACFIFITLFLLPNVSVVYAQALEQIPIIGDIVRVVTIRNYFYSDDKHEMDIDVPQIEDDNDAAEQINQDINQMTETLVQEFYEEVEFIGDEGHSSLYLDYEIVTNSNTWFTLKIMVHKVAGSGTVYYKFYHINKKTNEIVKLGDLAKDNSFYDVVVQEIKRQMKIQMENDSSVVYWLEDSIIGQDFVSVSETHNFYWNSNGDLVIIFDEYEVAPGAMGTPEFVIEKDVIKDVLKPEYVDITS